MTTESATSIDRSPVASLARQSSLALVLAFAAGATDAFAFLVLGGVFTANMTGNLVLAGLTQRAGYGGMILAILGAIAAFCAAVYVAARVAAPMATIGRLVTVLAAACVAQAIVLVVWLARSEHSGPMLPVVLIALSAFAMGCQTAVARRVELRSGVTTTYVTGTLTSLMSDLADHREQAWGTRVGVVLMLVTGALAGSLLIGVASWLGAALPVAAAAVGTVILIGSRPRQP